MKSAIKGMSPRCLLFLHACFVKGYETAKRESGYSDSQVARIFKSEAVRQYMEKQRAEAYEKAGLTHDMVVRQAWAMAQDKSIPGSARKDLIISLLDRFEAGERERKESDVLPAWAPAQLETSERVEVKDAEVVYQDMVQDPMPPTQEQARETEGAK
jgi:hypothetical protein